MKKMKFFALMFLAGTLIFSSCDKDDEEVAVAGPSLTFQNGENSMEFDGSKGIDIRLDFTAEGEVSTFKLVFSLNNSTADSIYDLTSTYKGDKSGNYTFTRSIELVGKDLFLDASGTVKYVFTLTDKENNTKTATYTVTAAAQTTPLDKEVTTGNFWHIDGPNAGAYDLDGEVTVSSTGDATTKSMVNIDPATPNTDPSGFTGSWNSLNGTEFVKALGFDYDGNATVEAASAAFSAGTVLTTVTNPAVNDIYIAKKGTTYYVIKITGVNPEQTKNNNGQITFSFKKQS